MFFLERILNLQHLLVIMTRELAVVFVHPLFLLTSPREDPKAQYILDKEKDKTACGSYHQYVKNMVMAYDYVKNNGIPSVFVLAFEEWQGRLIPRPIQHASKFHPLEHSLIFEWSMGEKTRGDKITQLAMRNERYAEMVMFQDIDKMGRAILSYNFKRIIVCGEMGPYDRNVEGCVGVLAKLLQQQNIQVQGLEGCVFPLIPQEEKFLRYWTSEGFMTKTQQSQDRIEGLNKTIQELRNATQTLYQNAVRLENLLKLAKAS